MISFYDFTQTVWKVDIRTQSGCYLTLWTKISVSPQGLPDPFSLPIPEAFAHPEVQSNMHGADLGVVRSKSLKSETQVFLPYFFLWKRTC